jgi:hypothetical protein
LAEALRQASLHPWPDENGDYYAARTLEDWWYAYKKGGLDALVQEPRSDQGKNRALDDATAAWVLEQVTQNSTVPLKVLYSHWQQNQRPLPSIQTSKKNDEFNSLRLVNFWRALGGEVLDS